MRNKTFTAGRSSVLGLLVALTLILALPGLGWAITNQQAKSFGESKELIEVKLGACLRFYTQDKKNAGNPSYLKAALGEEEFEATITHSTDPSKRMKFSTRGIKDATSGYLRGEAAKIIVEFGESTHVPLLLTKMQAEPDAQKKYLLYFAAIKLEYKYLPENGKDNYIIGHLTPTFFMNMPGDWVNLFSSYFLSLIEKRKLTAATTPLMTLRGSYSDNKELVSLINDTLAVLQFLDQRRGKTLQDIYLEALRDNNSYIRLWAERLLDQDTAQNQTQLNNLLVCFLKDRDSWTLEIKEIMKKRGILRSENLNPSFEIPEQLATGVPTDWTIETTAGVGVSFSAEAAHSYKRGVQVNNNSRAVTRLKNSPATFLDNKPEKIEYGLFYHLVDSTNELDPVTGEAIIPKIAIIPHITYSDDSNNEGNLNAATLTTGVLYKSNSWIELDKELSATAANPIKSVRLEVVVSGKVNIYLDDIYVRRGAGAYSFALPQVDSLSVSSPFILAGEYVTLQAGLTNAVTGTWTSDLDGVLGKGRIITARLSKPGTHTISFEAEGDFGVTSLTFAPGVQYPQVIVAQPVLTLTASGITEAPDRITPISGNITLNLAISGLERLPAGTRVDFATALYGNDKLLVRKNTSPYTYILDTTYLANDFANLQVKAHHLKDGRAIGSPILSNILCLYIANPASRVPFIFSPQDGEIISTATDVVVGLENPAYSPQYCKFFMRNRLYNLFQLGQDIRKVALNPQNYPEGNYDLYVLAHYLIDASTAVDLTSEPVAIRIAFPPKTALPLNLSAVVLPGSKVQLQWLDRFNNEDGFYVKRSLAKNDLRGSFSLKIAEAGKNTTQYIDTTVSPGVTYYYFVCAYNQAGESALSNQAEASLLTPRLPSGLTGSVLSPTQIQLRWQDNSNNEDGFRIERSTSGRPNNFTQLAQVGANVTTYTDNGLTPGVTYYYRVRAFNNLTGASLFSNLIQVPLVSAPNPVSNLTATALSSSAIQLRWQDNSHNEDWFYLERSLSGRPDDFTRIATLAKDTTQYTDTGLNSEVTYYYRVFSYNSVGNSTYSNTAQALLLAAPSQLRVSFRFGEAERKTLHLSWVNNSHNTKGFRIERRTEVDNFSQVAEVTGSSATTYTDTGLTGLVRYYYRVCVFNETGNSDYSNEGFGVPRP